MSTVMVGDSSLFQRRLTTIMREEQIKLKYAREWCIPMNGNRKIWFQYLKAKTMQRITTLSISKYARVKIDRIKETKKKY
jgi:hypothetical protein